DCRAYVRPGGARYGHWMRKVTKPGESDSTSYPWPARTICCRRYRTGAAMIPRGVICHRQFSSASGCCMTSSVPTTHTPAPGTRLGSAGRPRLAVMCAWISTGTTRGRPPRHVQGWKSRLGATMPEFDNATDAPRATGGRAPDVFRVGGWVPMRQYRDDEVVDFAIVGTGAGGGTLACKLAEYGFSVVALDAGPYWRPLEDFASDEHHQAKLYWTDERIVDGDNPLQLGSNNSGKSVGGSTVHFAMVSLRFRPEWFKSRTKLGYGADWPLDWREMWKYYHEVENTLKISGPINYPWGPPRPRYPYRAHELNAAALALAEGAEALGIAWTETPLATVSAPRGKSP